jgi:processive 1,2-diacylglycerol beta-glucosyltransferase
MKILIISTKYTGMGHNSISQSIIKELDKRNIEAKQIEIFDYTAKIVKANGQDYINIIDKKPKKWKFWYDFAHHHMSAQAWFFQWGLRKNFLKLLDEYKPDMIVGVHPCFVRNILHYKQKYHLNFKHVTVIADLISISNSWIDPRSDLTIFPTKEGYEFSLAEFKNKKKFSQLKYDINMLPIRSDFVDQAQKITIEDIEKPKDPNSLFKIVIISGAAGTANTFEIAQDLIKLDNVLVTLVCGKNTQLKESLDFKYKDESKIKVLGFVTDFASVLIQQDLIILRGSPNSILEALNFCIPIIVTSAVYGQELGNIDFVVDNKIGFFCPTKEETISTINKLRENNYLYYLEIRRRQFFFRQTKAVTSLVDKILEQGTK